MVLVLWATMAANAVFFVKSLTLIINWQQHCQVRLTFRCSNLAEAETDPDAKLPDLAVKAALNSCEPCLLWLVLVALPTYLRPRTQPDTKCVPYCSAHLSGPIFIKRSLAELLRVGSCPSLSRLLKVSGSKLQVTT